MSPTGIMLSPAVADADPVYHECCTCCISIECDLGEIFDITCDSGAGVSCIEDDGDCYYVRTTRAIDSMIGTGSCDACDAVTSGTVPGDAPYINIRYDYSSDDCTT